MKNKIPVVTIGITTYDRVELLKETITSILNQSFQDFFILISNDNPQRNLIISDLGLDEDSRIKISNQLINLGETENLNWLLDNTISNYFTWLADDDVLHPKFLEVMIDELTKDSTRLVIYSDYCHGSNVIPSFFELSEIKESKTYNTREFIEMYSTRKISLIGCYGLFHTDELRKIGGFKQLGSGFSPGSDTLIPIQLSQNTKIGYVESALIFLRTHQGSQSASSADIESYSSAEFDFVDELRDVISEMPRSSKKIIYKGFMCWFADNHLTVLNRRSKLNVFLKYLVFGKFEILNIKNFSRNQVGLLFLVEHFFYTFKILGVDLIQRHLFPKVKSIPYFPFSKKA